MEGTEIADVVNEINYWNYIDEVLSESGTLLNQVFYTLWHAIYSRCTLLNLAILFLKYIPTAVYMYKFPQGVYRRSKEILKRKQRELEEIQLQIQIVNTKISMRDGECEERLQRVRRSVEKLRQVRARVRDVIAGDSALRHALQLTTLTDYHALHTTNHPDQDNEFLNALVRDIKKEDTIISDRTGDNLEYSDTVPSRTDTTGSVYSALSDTDEKKDCNFKIIKVTNVYKVAYLKHYIKKNRLKRATKHSTINKKVENIKQLLENWQKTLNMVINNSKLTLLNLDPHPIDVVLQKAMGDYRPTRNDSDSDDEMRNSNSDTFLDEYGLNCSYPYDEMNGPLEKTIFDSQEFGDSRYTTSQCQYNLERLPEETISQIAIEEIKSEASEVGECRDLVIL